jgi:hypothetical protein
MRRQQGLASGAAPPAASLVPPGRPTRRIGGRIERPKAHRRGARRASAPRPRLRRASPTAPVRGKIDSAALARCKARRTRSRAGSRNGGGIGMTSRPEAARPVLRPATIRLATVRPVAIRRATLHPATPPAGVVRAAIGPTAPRSTVVAPNDRALRLGVAAGTVGTPAGDPVAPRVPAEMRDAAAASRSQNASRVRRYRKAQPRTRWTPRSVAISAACRRIEPSKWPATWWPPGC